MILFFFPLQPSPFSIKKNSFLHAIILYLMGLISADHQQLIVIRFPAHCKQPEVWAARCRCEA